jgi:ferredoxin, 2Fe-2S
VPEARFVGAGSAETVLDVPNGQTLKQAAVDNLVPGIIGDCGGYATCGTCHVVVDEPFRARLPTPSEDEEIMLEGLLTPVTAGSRLACQITMADDLDGITVHVPESQG